MKHFVTLLSIFLVISCTAQNKNTPMKKERTVDQIKAQGLQIKEADTIFMKDGKLDIARLEEIGTASGSLTPQNYQYETNLDNNIYISGNRKSGYFKKITPKDDLFMKYYEYYGSGRIKNYGRLFSREFADGIWYWFNEQGAIEKYEDYDAPYTFTWEDVQTFLKEQKIKEEEIIGIHRSDNTGIHKWAILYKPKELLNTDDAKFIHLDAKTGKIIKTGIYSTARHLD